MSRVAELCVLGLWTVAAQDTAGRWSLVDSDLKSAESSQDRETSRRIRVDQLGQFQFAGVRRRKKQNDEKS
jgi:hypothetical protein